MRNLISLYLNTCRFYILYTSSLSLGLPGKLPGNAIYPDFCGNTRYRSYVRHVNSFLYTYKFSDTSVYAFITGLCNRVLTSTKKIYHYLLESPITISRSNVGKHNLQYLTQNL